MACASSSDSSAPVLPKRPMDFAAAVIRFIDRPMRQTERLFSRAAIITDSSRATLDAKLATATPRPSYSAMSFVSSARTPSSEPAMPGEKTLVESQIIASTPSLPSLRKASSSTGSPICGDGSIFQSPVCSTVPSFVRMASAFGSGIEWVSVMRSISNGPISILPPSWTRLSGTSSNISASPKRSLTRYIVKGVAQTGQRMRSQRRASAPI